MSEHSKRLGFLDGLRGVSILLVLLGHILPKNQSRAPYFEPFFDGALGVRIFFVISGFIITWLLLQEKHLQGKILWGDFFLKRMTKLLPSLALYVGLLWVFSHFETISCTSSAYLVALLFLTEIFGRKCWHLGHTWSLSVEEFFYLLWLPVIQWVDFIKIKKLIWITLCLGPLVRVYNYLILTRPNLFPFEGTAIPFFGHADVIGFGALAAWFCFSRTPNRPVLLHRIPGLSIWLVGLFFLSALPFYSLDKLSLLKYLALPFSSTIQGLVVSILIVALFSGASGVFSKVLNLSLFRFFGRISYSLYLWQQPFLNPYQADWSSQKGILHSLTLLGIALTAGILFFYAFEDPMMRLLRRKLKVSSSQLMQTSC